MRISDGVQTCALPISRIPAQRPVFLRDPRKADEDGMQRRSQEALTAMRQILRATENYARRLSRLTGLTASQPLLLQVLAQHGERSEEHTSELQSLMRISYAVFCLKKKNTHT